MICYIDKYGTLVEKCNAIYTILLQGSYEWSFIWNGWMYDIVSIEPKIPLSRLFSSEMLFEKSNSCVINSCR